MNKGTIRLSNGAEMPLVGLGTGKVVEDAEGVIVEAIRLGYRHFDTATAYLNENSIGRAIDKAVSNGTVERKDLFITTKLPLVGLHPERVQEFVDISISKLKIDYIDLYLIHWPVGLIFVDHEVLTPRDKDGDLLLDMQTNLCNIWRALEDQVHNGKIKAIGLSNFNERQIQLILNNCRIPPQNLQVEMHAYFQQKSLRQLCDQNGISMTAYAPLGSPGRAQYYINTDNLKVPPLFEDEVVHEIAKSHGKTPAQVLLKFLIQALKVAVIPKSVNSTRMQQNIELFDFELSNVEIEKLEKLDKGEEGRSCPPFQGANDHPECPF